MQEINARKFKNRAFFSTFIGRIKDSGWNIIKS